MRPVLLVFAALFLAVLFIPSCSSAITGADVAPASLTVGTSGTATITFTTAAAIPADSWINVTFPAGFSVGSANSGACAGFDGSLTTSNPTGQVVRLARGGIATEVGAGAQSCTIAGITNPTTAGPAATYDLLIANATTPSIDSGTAAADTFLAAAPDTGTSTIWANETLINPGDPIKVAVQLRDQYGNDNTTGDQTVTWTTTGIGDTAMTHDAGGNFSHSGVFGPTANGTYTLTGKFASNTLTSTTSVTVNAVPTANAGPDNSTATDHDGSGSETVDLDGTGSSDVAPGTIATYTWSEGGSTIATGATPSVAFTVGTHTVNLTVTDDNGAASAKDTVIITVNANPAPTADAGADNTTTDTDGDGSQAMTLDGTASTDVAPGTIASYSWKWASNGTVLATGAMPTVNIPVGTYTLNLTVTDNGGATSAIDQVTVTVKAKTSGDSGTSGGGDTTGSHGYKTGVRYSSSYSTGTQHTLQFTSGAVDSIEIVLDDGSTVTITVSTKDRSASDLPTGYRSTTIWMDITFSSSSQLTSATVTLRPLDPALLDGDWQDLVAFHQTDAGWAKLPTTVESQGDGTIVITFTTTSFSPFVLAFDETQGPTVTTTETATATTTTTTTAGDPTSTGTASGEGSQQSPGLGLAAVFVLLVVAAIGAVRRR